MMGAYINALREEGTRADLLREIERLLDQRSALLKAIDEVHVIAADAQLRATYQMTALEQISKVAQQVKSEVRS